MTINKLTKSDLIKAFSRIKIEKLSSIPENVCNDISALSFALNSEKDCTLKSADITSGNNLIRRNVICFQNALTKICEHDFISAWYEITDILDFKDDNDYVTENEIALIAIAVELLKINIIKHYLS